MAAYERNPYAPPAEVDDRFFRDADASSEWRADFGSQRFSVAFLFFLEVITLGLMTPIWLIMRSRFLDGLRVPSKIGAAGWVLVFLVGVPMALVLGGAVLGEKDWIDIGSFVLRLSGIAQIIAVFRARRVLNEHLDRRGWGPTEVSGVATFFFGVLYLQYKINSLADRS